MLKGAGRNIDVSRSDPKNFNRFCLLVATFWLLFTIPFGILLLPPRLNDFSQFYMGGTIAARAEWQALYPIPHPNGTDNPGLSIHSYAKKRWNEIREAHRVPNDTRFILPPPSALIFTPFSFLSIGFAYWTWIFLLTASVWGVGLLAGRLYRSLVGHPTSIEGLLLLLISFSPLTSRAIRIANVSPLIALCSGLIVLSLVRRSQSILGGTSLLIGILLKYATLVLAPLLIAMRQWRMVLCFLVSSALILMVTLVTAGFDPFFEFYTSILPTLSRPSAFSGNQSLMGMLIRIWGRPLPIWLKVFSSTLQMVLLMIMLGLIFTVRPIYWRRPSVVMAGAASLLSWLLIFSPIAWEHWPVFLCPLWGWLIWESQHLKHLAPLPWVAILFMWAPAGIFQVEGFFSYPIFLPEPLNTWQLFGVGLVFLLAIRRLKLTQTTDIQLSSNQTEHELKIKLS